jgi:phospholipase/carboxylesterase
MGVAAALREPSLFAGVAALSGMGAPEMLPEDPQAVKGLPVLVTHGRWDPVVPIAQGRALRELLSGLPLELTYKEYDMAHEINQECLEDLKGWLRDRLES